jgi:3-hydroxy acid dehydrogenase / malonic semialdehyde reductase
MLSLQNQTVFISGASSGIGAACAQAFAQTGARLILAARRLDRLQTLADSLDCPTHLLQLDVGDRRQVEVSLATLPPDWSQVDILINNAGLSRGLDKLHDGKISDWEEMIDTNIKGLLYVTRTLLPGMVSRDRGHVINIGSVAGHQAYPNGNVYCATKAAVRMLSEGIRLDLFGTAVRITSVDPGMVETEFSQVRFHGDGDRAQKVYDNVTPLSPEDIAETVLFCATRPAHVNISELVVWPTAQRSATLVHRQG